jgi:hypothetical protein
MLTTAAMSAAGGIAAAKLSGQRRKRASDLFGTRGQGGGIPREKQ